MDKYIEERTQRLQELLVQQDSDEAYHEAIQVATSLLGGFLMDIHTIAQAQHKLARDIIVQDTVAEREEREHNGGYTLAEEALEDRRNG
jgi:hypothetical protein